MTTQATRGTVTRLALVAALTALLGFTLGVDGRIRGWEALLSSEIVSLVTGTRTGVNPFLAIVSFPQPSGPRTGLQITPECTSAFLVLPLLIVTGLVTWLRKRLTFWPIAGLAVTTALLFATNQVRILAVVLLIRGMGFDEGYYWGHTMIGSLISVFGIGISLVIYVMFAVRGRHKAGAA
jgi:exosortase/archaeosortase family protein